MDTKRIAPGALPFTLYRVNPDESRDVVSEHPDFESGWSTGTHVVMVEDTENATVCTRATGASPGSPTPG